MSDSLFQRLSRIYHYDKLPWVIISIGVLLRLIRYFSNTSLSFDEADTAVDVISRPFSDLIEPSSDWNVKYPYGHMMLLKLASHLFGNSEYALRFVALSFGILSIILFYRVAKKFINPAAVPVALCLFAVSDHLVYQASNMKPYSGDLVFALIIILWVDHIRSKRVDITNVLIAGLTGAIMVWFSHSSLFVLAGAGACLLIFSYRAGERSKIGAALIIGLIWATSFGACYLIYLQNLLSSFNIPVEDLMKIEHAFIPFPPRSLSDFKVILDSFFGIFDDPAGFSFTGIAGFVFLVGGVSMFRENKDRFYILIAPLFVTLLASILHQYPFKGRLIVFLVPFVLLFIAEGAEYVREKISVKSAVPGMVLIGVLLVYPLSWAAYHAKAPSSHEEIRPVISYIKNNWQDGDIVYVHYYAQYAFEYYTKYHPARYVFEQDDYIVGIAPRGWYRRWRKKDVAKYYDPAEPVKQSSVDIFKVYARDLDNLKGNKRVWVLFMGNIPKDGINEEKFFVYHLETIGKQLDSFGRPWISSVYLYDLSGIQL